MRAGAVQLLRRRNFAEQLEILQGANDLPAVCKPRTHQFQAERLLSLNDDRPRLLLCFPVVGILRDRDPEGPADRYAPGLGNEHGAPGHHIGLRGSTPRDELLFGQRRPSIALCVRSSGNGEKDEDGKSSGRLHARLLRPQWPEEHLDEDGKGRATAAWLGRQSCGLNAGYQLSLKFKPTRTMSMSLSENPMYSRHTVVAWVSLPSMRSE